MARALGHVPVARFQMLSRNEEAPLGLPLADSVTLRCSSETVHLHSFGSLVARGWEVQGQFLRTAVESKSFGSGEGNESRGRRPKTGIEKESWPYLCGAHTSNASYQRNT